MSDDEKFNLYTCFLSVSQCLFPAFWQAEIAISAQHHIHQQVVCSKHVWIYLFGNRKFYKPSTFPILLLREKLIFKNSLYIYMHSIQWLSIAVSTLHVQLR
jgi:hypothetical protein